MNAKEIKVKGITYVFVTRDDEKPITQKEIQEFLYGEYLLEEEQEVKQFIPDDKTRKRLFLKDLKLGVDFCVKKYGVTRAEVIAEAKRIAPHVKVL